MDTHLKPVENSQTSRVNRMPTWVVVLLLTMMTITGLSAANAEVSAAQGSSDNESLVSTSRADNTYTDADTISEQPETLVGYIKQQIKEEGEKETRYPTRKLQANTELTGEYNEAYYVVNELNTGLPTPAIPPNLETPLATLEFFNTANLQNDFALAAYALNLNSIADTQQVNLASELVRKLDYLLTEKDLYVFDEMPDRADGLVEPSIGSNNPIHGVPRRSIKLGSIDYKNRSVPIHLERVKVEGQAPVWVFSSQTVMNIEALYDIHKPAQFERYFPDWLSIEIFSLKLWEIFGILLFMVLTMGLGLLMSKGAAKLTTAYSDKKLKEGGHDELSLQGRGVTDLFSKITAPLTVFISFSMMFALVSGSFPKIDAMATSLRPIIWIGLVISALWLGIRTINFFANRYQDYQIDALDEEEFIIRRERMTYVSIFRRIFIFVIVMGGFWISLAEFTDLEGLGKTLLTSAGIAGAVIGIAAQPTLGNIIAGFQVAVTQPVRIGDTVMIDGIWSEVEDLRYTYAVLQTWDNRRLIVPMKHFVTEIIENWSHTTTSQTYAVYLYVDYGADIEAIKQKFIEFTKANELWDNETEPDLQVTDVTESTIKLRGKVSAEGPLDAWDLSCDVRRQMLDYLNNEQGDYLPTDRITLSPRAQ